jgi:hypothetical protein
MPCDVCGGTGVFPDNYVYIPKLGKLIKDSLVMRKMTLREASKYYDVDATELAMWKKGIFRRKGGE